MKLFRQPQKKKVEYKEINPIELVKFKQGKYGVRTNPLTSTDMVPVYYSSSEKAQFRDTHEILLYCMMEEKEAERLYKSFMETGDVEVVK